MKRKFLSGAMQPLISKKRSKKRKIIIYEYENNISDLMRKLKIEDNGSESSSSDESMPPNIRSFESSMKNKLMRCNLKTYSSYSSSKNINVYKKAESKCIRFISVSTYLQGKVFSVPDFSKLAVRQFSSLYGIKNKTIVTAPKPLLSDKNAFSLKQVDRRLTKGHFGSTLNLNIKCSDIYKSIRMDLTGPSMYDSEFILSIRQLGEFSLKKLFKELVFPKDLMLFAGTFRSGGRIFCNKRSSSSSLRFELVPHSNINRSYDNFDRNYKAVETDVESICNDYMEDEKYTSETMNRNMDRIQKTILELVHLGLKIENYISVLKMFNYISTSTYDISELKNKFADLVMNYKYLQTKKYKINNEKCIGSNFLGNEIKIEEKYDSYAENVALNTLDTSVNTPYVAIKKQSCKRSRKKKDENPFILKRSKTLDDCISRVNGVDKFNVELENTAALNSEVIQGNNVQKIYEDKNRYEGKMFNVISDSCRLSGGMKTDPSSDDISNEEKRQISLNLPPFHEAFKDIQKIKRKVPEPGNSSNTIRYDLDDGRKLVILPYINIY